MPIVPLSSGLILCDNVIIEERTRNASLINIFTARRVDAVPDVLNPFYAFAMVTSGHGECDLDFKITFLEDELEVCSIRGKQAFPGPLTAVRLVLKIERCRVPDFGIYQAALFFDGEWVAERNFRILPKGSRP